MFADSSPSVYASTWQHDQLFPNYGLDELLNTNLDEHSDDGLKCLTSSSSSDCTEDLYNHLLSVDDDNYLDSTLNTMLDLNTPVFDPSELPWSETDLGDMLSDVTCPSSSQPDSMKDERSTHSNQRRLVEQLTHIIGSELGVREQLEVLRIINPSQQDDMVIDLENLTEDKLRKVQEYISQLHHEPHNTTNNNNDNSKTNPKNPAKKMRVSVQQQQQQQQQQEQQQRGRRRRGRSKGYKQQLKERRSGLFGQEQVLALSTADDEDVDILC